MTKYIELSQGKVASVSDRDFKRVQVCSWHYRKEKHGGYAVGRPFGKKYGLISMHRFIMGCTRGDGIEIDHKDLDGLNNTRGNLRFATHKQNRQHNRLNSANKTGYMGVSFFRQMKTPKWRAAIVVDGKQKHLGLFDTPEAAAIVYDAAAQKHFGRFASLNFPHRRL